MPDSRGPPYPTAPIRRIVGGLVMLAVIVGMAVLGYMLAGWSLIDALYMVVITITTKAGAVTFDRNSFHPEPVDPSRSGER